LHNSVKSRMAALAKVKVSSCVVAATQIKYIARKTQRSVSNKNLLIAHESKIMGLYSM
jgi:hypothetical protein